MTRLWSLVGTYVFYCGRSSCPVKARRSLLNGPEDFGALRAKPQPLALVGFLISYLTLPPLGISTTLIHEAGQAYITFSVYPHTFSSTEDYVFRGTKNIFCMLTPPGRLPGRLFPHLPLPFSSGSFCCSHSAKQIFCSLATCCSLCQAVKQIPGASGTVVLLGGDCG